jgi:hypothetical protein
MLQLQGMSAAFVQWNTGSKLILLFMGSQIGKDKEYQRRTKVHFHALSVPDASLYLCTHSLMN